MKQKLHFTIAALLFAITAWAQGPNESGTYYSAADGKKGAELKTALCGIITSGHQKQTYDALWTHYETTDKRADGKVWDMYSNTSNFTFGTDQDRGSGGNTEGDKYNREHSFPNSWFGGQKGHIAYADLFHLYPTDKLVNNRRGNNPFGENNGEKYSSSTNFSKLGNCTYSGYTGVCFEPNDIYKGDFARTYFYMVTRYENEIATWYNENSEARPHSRRQQVSRSGGMAAEYADGLGKERSREQRQGGAAQYGCLWYPEQPQPVYRLSWS